MKQQLKYIKLFEAFDSIKLSKTMRFINRESKKKFLNQIKKIADVKEFPISKLDDSLFEYLPFKSALKKNVDLKKEEPQECNHESDWISGEFCKGGMVKRTWGKGFRIVTCTHCNGSGFKPVKKAKPELTYIKFWFDKDGNYITTTGTSGAVIPQNTSSTFGKQETTFFSDNLSDYDVSSGPLSFEETKSLPTGTFVKITIGGSDYIVGLIWHSNSKTYVLQNSEEGSRSSGDEWRSYAEYSWYLGSEDDDMNGPAYKLEPKDKNFVLKFGENQSKEKEKEKTEIDPYSINNILNFNYLSLDNYRDMEQRLNGAHFALILDFKKMRDLEVENVRDLNRKRNLARSGALALKNPEDIKNANVQRYINGLVNRFEIGKGFPEISKLIPRALGWNNSITFVLNDINLDRINSVISYIYRFMKTDPEDTYGIRNIEDSIKSQIKSIYETTSSYNQTMNFKIQEAYKMFDEMKNIPKYESYHSKMVLIFDKYLSLGELLNKKLSDLPCETIGDLELILQKISSIRRIWAQGRMEDLSRLRYAIDYMRRTSYKIADEIADIDSDYYDDILKELDELKKIIEKI